MGKKIIGNQLKTSLLKACDAINQFEKTKVPKVSEEQKRTKLLKSIKEKLEDF